MVYEGNSSWFLSGAITLHYCYHSEGNNIGYLPSIKISS